MFIKVARETIKSAKTQTNALYKRFDSKKNCILKDVDRIQSDVNRLSTLELTESVNKLTVQIYSISNELHADYNSHYENVESEYRTIKDSTLKYIKSIK